MDRVDIQRYMNTTKNCIEWDKEFIFDCGKDDIPLNYSFMQNANVFKEFKMISSASNTKYH